MPVCFPAYSAFFVLTLNLAAYVTGKYLNETVNKVTLQMFIKMLSVCKCFDLCQCIVTFDRNEYMDVRVAPDTS